MQPGSIVVVKAGYLKVWKHSCVRWLPTDNEETTYVVREIVVFSQKHAARLEEGVIGYNRDGVELAINIAGLIEVMPPSPLAQQLLEESPETVFTEKAELLPV